MSVYVSELKNARVGVREEPIFGLSNAREYFSYLIELVRVKDGLNVKARDLTRFLGVEDHVTITRFGILLNKLSEVGLAVRWNNNRPLRYTLTPKELWLKYVSICDFRCSSKDCPLAGLCPYHIFIRRFGGEAYES